MRNLALGAASEKYLKFVVEEFEVSVEVNILLFIFFDILFCNDYGLGESRKSYFTVVPKNTPDVCIEKCHMSLQSCLLNRSKNK